MAKHRLFFSKTGRAKYLSHLDLMRTIQRVFARAGVAVKHTEGFNPHAYVSVALPLSVGVESVCELLDFALVDDTPLADLPELLTRNMPEGIEVLEAYEADTKLKDIAFLRVRGVLTYDVLADTTDMAEKLSAFFGQESIPVKKLTKKKTETEVDIIPLVREIAFTAEGAHRVQMEAVIAAQNPGLNPSLLIEALRQHAPEPVPDFVAFSRAMVYNKDMKEFR